MAIKHVIVRISKNRMIKFLIVVSVTYCVKFRLFQRTDFDIFFWAKFGSKLRTVVLELFAKELFAKCWNYSPSVGTIRQRISLFFSLELFANENQSNKNWVIKFSRVEKLVLFNVWWIERYLTVEKSLDFGRLERTQKRQPCLDSN